MILRKYLIFIIYTFIIISSQSRRSTVRRILSGLVPKLDGRIVGGFPADIEQYPYQLSYQYNGRHLCGASVIGASWALCAAHCTYGINVRRVTLRAGSTYTDSGGTVHAVSKIITHSNYDGTTNDYDISLIKVSKPFEFSNYIQPIDLAEQLVEAGTSAVVSGWGVTREGSSDLSSNLQQVEVTVVSRAVCRLHYLRYGITQRMFCAGTSDGKDSCQGDSGGPLVSGNVLIGIVSWGIGCANSFYPGVYTNVADLRNWIKSKCGI